MSDHWLILIPTDPGHVPSTASIVRASELLRSLVPGADAVEADIGDQVRFVDCGAKFAAVHCPRCEAAIADDWWRDTVDRASQIQFTDLAAITPCCGAAVSLNDLDYRWPQGFARFELAALNPDVAEQIPDWVSRIETALGCPLRVVRRHL